MTKSKWIAFAAGVAGVSLVALSVAILMKAGYACANPSKRVGFKIAEANGCIEFWFNRYQTTIAAVVSIAVALYVIRPALSQVREMRKQSSSEARQVLRENITDMSNELTACQSLRYSMFGLDAYGYSFAYHNDQDDGPPPSTQTMQEIITQTASGIEKVQEYLGADPANARLEDNRQRLIKRAREAHDLAGEIAGLSVSLANIGRTKAEIYNELGDAAHTAAEYARDVAVHQETAIREARAKLRELESVITKAS